MKRSYLILLALTALACDDRSPTPNTAITVPSQPSQTAPTTPSPLPADNSEPTTRATTRPDEEPATMLPTIQMLIKDQPFTLEVADDDPEMERGLMFRNSMPSDHGMIFVFPNEAQRGFWMKNTYIPLDILYVASDGKIVSIQKMYAQDLSTYDSIWPAQYAIELNAGTANKVGLKSGDMLAIPDSIKPKKITR